MILSLTADPCRIFELLKNQNPSRNNHMEFLFAYLAGVLMLINPCVLPVLPIVLVGAVNANRAGPYALGADPSYDGAMTFVKVDWDTYSRHAVTVNRGIPRRSMLIVLRGDDELGRIVAGTSQSQIKSLMDRGL